MIYERRSRLSGKQQRRLIDLFVAGSDCAGRGRACRCEPKHRTNVLPSTPSAHRQQAPSYDLSGEVEADESSFAGGSHRQPWPSSCRQGARMGLVQTRREVFTAIMPNARSRTLLPIIREQVPPDSIVYR